MSEETKSIWRKSLGKNSFLFCLLIAVIGATVIAGIGAACGLAGDIGKFAAAWLALVLILWLLATAVSWLCCWRNFKKFLFGCACLAVLDVLFYAEEDWRGRHAWNSFRKTWEAKGERFDRASVVPPAVPDEQNFVISPVVASCYADYLTPDGRRITSGQREGSTNVVHWVMTPDGTKISSEIPFTNVVNRLDFDLGFATLENTGVGYWAKATVSDLKILQAYYRELAAKTNLFAVPPQPQSPAADVLLALSKFDSTVEELRAAARRPEARFPLEYEADCPEAILLPHLAALKSSSQLLKIRSIAELQNGDSDKALADVRLALRLADSLRCEPTLISHLVRIAILQITIQPVYEGLATHRWSDAQLAELDTMLAKENFVADYRAAMRGEMVMFQIGCIQYLRRHPQDFFSEEFMGDPVPKGPTFLAWLIPDGWFYQSQLRCVRMTQEFFLPAADAGKQTVFADVVREAGNALAAETKQVTPYNVLERMLMPALTAAIKKFAYAQATVDLAHTAVALERYRLAHGNFPATLDALAPQFIAQVPHDVIGGQPLKYSRTADGQFILYSVGWNETDDGGTIVLNKGSIPAVDTAKGDWVWKYPKSE
jgi:hypothetical protein